MGQKSIKSSKDHGLTILSLEPFSLKQREKIALQYGNHAFRTMVNTSVFFAGNGFLFFSKAKAFMENILLKEKKRLGPWLVTNSLCFA